MWLIAQYIRSGDRNMLTVSLHAIPEANNGVLKAVAGGSRHSHTVLTPMPFVPSFVGTQLVAAAAVQCSTWKLEKALHFDTCVRMCTSRVYAFTPNKLLTLCDGT